MCGIAGIYLSPASSGVSEQAPEIIEGLLSRIAHRGPDAYGYYVDDRFAMGTARLSIIDLEAGTQPMSDSCAETWICFNGEIYNYIELREALRHQGVRFVTESDTEVLLHAWRAWGPDCLPRLNGAFAMAIYEPATGRLVLARDRFGKRPLFYAETDVGLVFASEMKSFLALPGFTFERDVSQLAAILGHWTPLPHQSGFRGIASLPMGEWLELREGQLTRHRYDRLRCDVEPHPGSKREAQAAIAERLRESVRRRLRSDVEVGVYLSGGLDSAIVAALACELSGQPLRTFSVEFEDREFDESSEQRVLAEFFGGTHEALRISAADIAENFPAAIFHAEVPAFRSAFVPMFSLSRAVRDAGIKVVLTGEGSDEAFRGYEIFKETRLRAAWNGLSSEQRKATVADLYAYLPHYAESGALAAVSLYQQFTSERLAGLFSHEIRLQNGRFCTRLLRERSDPFASLVELVANEPGYADLDPIQKAQWLEYRTLLAGYLLSTQGERMSLAHGVENRCPFLDPGVVEIAMATNWRHDDGTVEKHLLREAFRGALPDAIVDKRKHPYRSPDAVAFVQAAPDYLELIRADAELRKLDYLDHKFARALVDKIVEGPPEAISTKDNQAFVFLLSLALLDRVFVRREGLPEPHPSSRRPAHTIIDHRTR